VPAGFGEYSDQVADAIRFYSDVVAANPGASITFTGHSLGGGLASLMAVYFDHPAVVFDAAPFKLSALHPVTDELYGEMYDAYQAAHPGRTPSAAFVEFRNNFTFAELARRQAAVTGYHIDGEILEAIRSDGITALIGTGFEVSVGNPDLGLLEPVYLHSMTLLSLCLLSEDFRQALVESPAALQALFRGAYTSEGSTTEPERNFLHDLIRNEVGVDGTPNPSGNGVLEAFTRDIVRTTTSGVTDMPPSLREALVKGVMEYYYEGYFLAASQGPQDFVHSGLGGVNLDFTLTASENGNSDDEGRLALVDSIEGNFYRNRSWLGSAATSLGDSARSFWVQTHPTFDEQGGAVNDVMVNIEGTSFLHGGSGNDLLIGGFDTDNLFGESGEDVLIGGLGTDTLDGGVNNDTLDGLDAEGGDTLQGGEGTDTYFVDAGDTIIDSDGLGSIYVGVNQIRLTGGSREQNSGLFSSADGYVSYEEVGNGVVNVHFGGQVIPITGVGPAGGAWSNGGQIISGLPGLGITLTTKDDDDDDNDDDTAPWATPFDGAERLICPLMIDLDGGGIQTISREQGVYFDHNQSGYAERTGWIAGNDGFLVWDKNNNGIIENGNELFGEFTYLSTGQWANNGYRVLGDMDENDDGVVDASDSHWTDIKVWVDQNYNGISELGEVHSLSEYSIASIGTTYAYDPNAVDDNGNLPTMVGQYTFANGQTGVTIDYMLRVDHQDTVPTSLIDITGTAIESMPDLKGYGDAGSLRQAMARDASGALQAMVQDFAAETDGAARLVLMNQIILKWSGSDTIDPNSRSTNGDIDARMLGALERFMGQRFFQEISEVGPTDDPLVLAIDLLQIGYRNLMERMYSQLMVQTHLKPLYDQVQLVWDSAKGHHVYDFTAVRAEFVTALNQDRTAALMLIGEFSRTLLGSGKDSSVLDYDQYFTLVGSIDQGVADLLVTIQETYAPSLSISVDTPVDSILTGGMGNDFLSAWSGNDTLNGAAGADWLVGNAGNDQLNGQDGADILAGNEGADVLDGGAGDDGMEGGSDNDTYVYGRDRGNDTISEENGTLDSILLEVGVSISDVTLTRDDTDLVLHIAGSTDTLTVRGHWWGTAGIEEIRFADGTVWNAATIASNAKYLGTPGADLLLGTEADERFESGDGDDTVEANGGADTVNAGAGADNVSGGSGDDSIDGGEGNDTLDAGDGFDVVLGGAGADFIAGGLGDDSLNGGEGDDYIQGAAGVDELSGDAGDDALEGGLEGDVYLFAPGFGQDVIQESDATPGSVDIVRFSSEISPENVSLYRDQSNLYLRVGSDLVTVQDHFTSSGSQIERVEFSNGTIWTSFALAAAAFVGSAGEDIFEGTAQTDSMFGEGGADTLDGGAGDDSIDGGADGDSLTGGAGNDTIRGGTGNDTIEGGFVVGTNGADVYLFERGDGQDTIYDSDSTAGVIDTIRFGADISPDDIVVSQNGFDRTFGIQGTNDRITIFNWYDGPSQRIERVEFADGTVWDAAYLALTNIVGTQNADNLSGTTDTDSIRGLGGNDLLLGDAGNDTLEGGSGNDSLYGGDGGDVIIGGAGDDNLFGGDDSGQQSGADVFVLGVGDGHDVISDQGFGGDVDTIRFSGSLAPHDINVYQRDNNLIFQIASSGETLTVLNGQWDTSYRIERIEFGNGVVWDATQLSFAIIGDELDNIEAGTALDDVVTSMGGTDSIETFAGNDYLDGGTGDDTLIGGQGNDIYVVDSEFDALTELSAQGTDEVRSTLAWTLATNFENLRLLGADNIDGAGNSAVNVITGNAGDNLIDGKAGADTLAGGAGNDIYVVDNAGDIVNENSAEGVDLVRSSVSFTLGANVENLTLTGSGAINATGNDLDNVLTGNSGNNVLTGGLGNDIYVVAQAGDSVVEGASAGIDLVQSSVTRTLSSNIENMTLMGSSALSGTGNELDNFLTGNSGVNTLSGLDGNDMLDGGAGADTLVGGLGDDTYIVDHAGEVITEVTGEGTDLVLANVTHTLQANVESLTLTGANAINGTGNALANTISGNSSANTLNGLGGGDTLVGGGGDDMYVVDDVLDVITEMASEGLDTVQSAVSYSLVANVENLTLTGSAAIDATGNDLDNVLTGNTGTNTLSGGLGNDTYVVNGAADVVVENVSEGIDLVQASVTYTLSANVEKLTLTGASAISATGNALDNVLTGNTAINTLTGAHGNDTLNGGAAADILVGGAGDDLYIVDDAGDAITEVGGEGIDTVESSVTYTLAAEVEQLTLTGTAAINATGNGLDNALIGNSGANTLSGGAGADTMTGGLGNDTYVVDSAGDVVVENAASGTDTVQVAITYAAGSNVENVTLTGSTAINATGNELNNTLRGNTGTNILTGGLGNDTYVVNNTTDTVVESAAEGTDLVQSSVTYTLASNVENLTLTGSAVINATGNELDNVLIGNTGVNILTGGGGNDTLDGGTGVDSMAGGTGDDTYIIEVAGENVTENASEGTDTAQASVTYTLAANVENLVLTGATAINGTGNGLNNVLTGNSVVNTLNGGAGADTMIGGGDNDIYVVDDVGDTIVENAAEGTDTVQSTVSYSLSSNVERITLTGAAAVNATGNDLDNLITGNSAVNMLNGGLGNDTYVVGSGDLIVEAADEGTDLVQSAISFALASNVENLTLTGSAAVDATGNEINNVLTGNTGINTLNGGQGNDTLNGGTGADSLLGGAGDDTYIVDNAGDTITENAAEGIDLVQSSIAYSLAANVENLTLTGNSAINATGNDLDNVLTGNSGINTLTGGQGNDTLNGAAGADAMIGGVGDDTYTVDNAGDAITENAAEGTDTVLASIAYTLGATLENLTLTGSSAIAGTGNALDNVLTGNTGVNVLTGGLGNDTYFVNNTTDTAVENAAEGTDAVFSSATFALGANVESLTLTGTASINATGNGTDNVLTGNSGNNTLNGGVGADTMSGDVGNDVYVVDDVGDVVAEGTDAGTDTVQSTLSYSLGTNLENITLTGAAAIDATGNSLDNVLTGNTGVNTLNGGAGNDTLNGGSGNDTMLGGTGDDTYVVAQAADVVTELDGEGTDLVQSSVTHTLSSFVENLMLTGSSNVNAVGNTLDNLLFGNTGTNTLTGNAGNDTLDGGAGSDTMLGGDGDDTYYSDVTGEVITEATSQGLDRVYSAVTQTLAANVEMLFLTGSDLINGTGNAASNLLRGNEVRNILVGGGGIDILEGGGGNDSLSNTGGGLFNGGSGNDTLTGGAGHDLFIGGSGNDAVTTSTGRDVIAFNLGDGTDTVSSSTTLDNTLSIGGGATYADLLFERSGNNLILKVGASDQITLTNYYTGSNHSLGTLQIVIEGTSDYDTNSANAMNNKKIESFDFDGLVAAFDAARANDPMLTSWALTNALLEEHLGGSDAAAIGGDLAYEYARFGSLGAVSSVPALDVLAAGTFGQSTQNFQGAVGMQDGSPRLS
jgi:trimeric autotransporter adhesin